MISEFEEIPVSFKQYLKIQEKFKDLNKDGLCNLKQKFILVLDENSTKLGIIYSNGYIELNEDLLKRRPIGKK